MNIEAFKKDLTALINQHCLENESNTPDFILADYLVHCLEAFHACSLHRERWYGKALTIGGVRDLPMKLSAPPSDSGA